MKGIKYYSRKELVLRVVWGAVSLFFFQLSPRFFYSWRNLVLRLFGAKIGRNVKIYPSARIAYPWLLQIANDSTVAWNVTIYNLGHVSIGTKTVISQNSHLCGGTHDYSSPDFILRRTGLQIGDNVWIAADAFIGPAVRVGDRSIVAARAVVTKDVAVGSIVAGNPARVIKRNVNGIRSTPPSSHAEH